VSSRDGSSRSNSSRDRENERGRERDRTIVRERKGPEKTRAHNVLFTVENYEIRPPVLRVCKLSLFGITCGVFDVSTTYIYI